MALVPGTYTVTASKDQYYAQTVDGVVVVEDQATTQDFSLQPLAPPVYLFCDDMESGSGSWTHNAAQGTDDWALVTTSYHSASHAWYTADVSTVSDKRLWNTTAVTIPSGAESALLDFWHSYGFESNRDGSVIEISTNGGATWTDLGPMIMQGGYNATLSTAFGNPLGGRQAWSGTAAWSEVKVDLTAYKGMSVQVRFRIGTDSTVAGTGWWIDDICFYTQSGGCTPVTNAAFSWTPTPPPVGETVTFSGSAGGTPPIEFSWDFGDGGTGSGPTATHSYGAVGSYIVTMTAGNACGRQVVTHDVTVQPLPNSLHISELTLSKAGGRPPFKITAIVTVHSQLHAPTGLVTVDATWIPPSGQPSRVLVLTKSNGKATFQISGGAGTYQFCVDNIFKDGYDYNPKDNEAPTCRSLSAP